MKTRSLIFAVLVLLVGPCARAQTTRPIPILSAMWNDGGAYVPAGTVRADWASPGSVDPWNLQAGKYRYVPSIEKMAAAGDRSARTALFAMVDFETAEQLGPTGFRAINGDEISRYVGVFKSRCPLSIVAVCPPLGDDVFNRDTIVRLTPDQLETVKRAWNRHGWQMTRYADAVILDVRMVHSSPAEIERDLKYPAVMRCLYDIVTAGQRRPALVFLVEGVFQHPNPPQPPIDTATLARLGKALVDARPDALLFWGNRTKEADSLIAQIGHAQ